MDITTISNAAALPSPTYSPAAAKQPSVPLQPSGEALPAETPVAGRQESDTVKITSSITSKNLDTVRAIEQMHIAMNKLTTGVRETNEALNGVADQARQLQQATAAITKNFPPFPIDSKERQEILMSYTSIKKEILQMTVPAPPPPIYERVKHLWEKTMGQNGQLLPQGVPPLQGDSSDQDVAKAGHALEQLGKHLDSLSSATTQALITPA